MALNVDSWEILYIFTGASEDILYFHPYFYKNSFLAMRQETFGNCPLSSNGRKPGRILPLRQLHNIMNT